MITVAAPL